MRTANLTQVAAGNKSPDLVLQNATVVNVFTRELIQADVALAGGYIAGVGSYEGPNTRDCEGLLLAPGFIDAHMHIESTMVTPPQLVRAVLPSGTTTIIADPHEIVNVAGAEGMRYMLAASRGLPCNIYYMLPSSVPATAFETAGAAFTAAEMEEFLHHEGVLGLGEVMCYPDVLAGAPHILAKLALFAGCPVDGHAPGLTGRALQAYAAAGVRTEHECTTFAESAEKARAGMAVLVREGSAAHNLKPIVDGILEAGLDTGRFMFCTDDKHLDDTARDGHIRWNVKLAVDAGMPLAEAVCMATLNTAREYGLRNIGAVAPGYRADLVLLDGAKTLNVVEVYKDGVPAATRLAKMPAALPQSEAVLHSVHCHKVSAADFALPAKGPQHVLEMVPYSLETRHLVEQVPTENGFFQPDETYTKLCVVERHGKNGNIALAALKGYGIRGGALATTVAHDSHNIIAAGDNDADLALAVNHLREINGGYVLVKNGRVAGDVPLPVAGLMSTATAEEVAGATHAILGLAKDMGIPYYIDPFISLSFLALPVIPQLRLTDRGLFDVEEFRLV